jgi:acyl-CoA thioesterase
MSAEDSSDAAQVGHPFDADTAVRPVGGGIFKATVTDRWNALGGGPNGGYLLAICLQALRREMPFPDPLAVSAYFLRRAEPGPAEVRTEIARTGRRLATGEVALLQGGREAVRAVATFTDLKKSSGRTLVLNEKPRLPPTEQSVDPLEGGSMPGLTLTDQVAYRMAEVPGWFRGEPSGDPRLEFWMRFKEGRAADILSLPFFVDAAAPIVMEIGEVASATIELTVHVRAHPAPGWLACRVATRHVIDGYHEEDFEIWDSSGKLVAQSRQLALLPATR